MYQGRNPPPQKNCGNVHVILNYKIALWTDFIICKWIYLSRNPISVMIKSCGWLVYPPAPQKRKKPKPPTRYDWKLLKTTLLRALVVQLFAHMMYWLYTGTIQKNEILYDTADNEKYSSGYEVWRVSGRLFISHQQIRMGAGGVVPLQRFK